MRPTALLVLSLLVRGLGGQDYAPAARGRYVHEPDRADPELPAAQRAAGLTAADTLLAILGRTELFRNPVGVTVSAWREVNVQRGGWQSGRPYYYGIGASIAYLVKGDDGQIEDGPGISLVIRVNSIPCAPVDNDGVEPDSGPPVSESREHGARITGRFREHDIYDGSCVVIAGRPGGPIVPLTKERYLRILIADRGVRAMANREEMRKPSTQQAGVPREMQARMDSVIRAARQLADSGLGVQTNTLKAQLAAMPPAERRRQAAVELNGVDGESLADVDSTDALPLVQLNPRWFDTTLPATTPQLISVELMGIQKGVVPFGYDESDDATTRRMALGVRLRDQLDWAAIESLVRRTPR
jgi:hypothetical protein